MFGSLRSRQVILGQPLDAVDQARPLFRPAEIHPAEERFGGHHGRRAAAGLVGIEGPIAVLHAVEIQVGHAPGFIGHGEVRGAGRLQGHELPADDARVAALRSRVRAYTASRRRCTGPSTTKSTAFWAGIAQLFVAGHREGFAQDDRRLAVRVHPLVAVGAGPQVAVLPLILDQPPQAAADGVFDTCRPGASGPRRGRAASPAPCRAPCRRTPRRRSSCTRPLRGSR